MPLALSGLLTPPQAQAPNLETMMKFSSKRSHVELIWYLIGDRHRVIHLNTCKFTIIQQVEQLMALLPSMILSNMIK